MAYYHQSPVEKSYSREAAALAGTALVAGLLWGTAAAVVLPLIFPGLTMLTAGLSVGISIALFVGLAASPIFMQPK